MNVMFAKLTSTHDTPLLVRKNAVIVVEGFNFGPDHSQCPNHVGSRLTLQAGQWTETVFCTETTETVIALLI